jgi:hypothetical protein
MSHDICKLQVEEVSFQFPALWIQANETVLRSEVCASTERVVLPLDDILYILDRNRTVKTISCAHSI